MSIHSNAKLSLFFAKSQNDLVPFCTYCRQQPGLGFDQIQFQMLLQVESSSVRASQNVVDGIGLGEVKGTANVYLHVHLNEPRKSTFGSFRTTVFYTIPVDRTIDSISDSFLGHSSYDHYFRKMHQGLLE